MDGRHVVVREAVATAWTLILASLSSLLVLSDSQSLFMNATNPNCNFVLTRLREETVYDVRACECPESADHSVAGATFAFLIDNADNRHNTKQSQQQWKVLSIY